MNSKTLHKILVFLDVREHISRVWDQEAKRLGDFISNLSASDALDYFNGFLRGDQNFKGTPSSYSTTFDQGS